jgi:hypothetical protein
MNPNIWILGTAVGSLVIGLALVISNRKSSNFQTMNLISWLLIALFPVLIIFSDFPAATISGSVLGFSVTGAVALFVFIWWFGTKRAMDAVHLDDVLAQNRQLQADLAAAKLATQQASQRVTVESAPRVLNETTSYPYALRKNPGKKIVLITGDIRNIKLADLWVNSENTNMQMARYHEKSVSGTIRYLGARKDRGEVVDDIIARELAAQVGNLTTVNPGTVFVTSSGEMAKTNRVRSILHVAAAYGQPGVGYKPVDNLQLCVSCVLDRAEDLAQQDRTNPPHSILFPLLGTGQAAGKVEALLDQLLMAAISHLEANPEGSIQTIYFLNWTDRELQACRDFLDKSDRVVKAQG